MHPLVAGFFATALTAGSTFKPAPKPTAEDIAVVVDEVNYVETAQKGIVLSGYVDPGYAYNFNGAGDERWRSRSLTGSGENFSRSAFGPIMSNFTLEQAKSDENRFQFGRAAETLCRQEVPSATGILAEASTQTASEAAAAEASPVVYDTWGNWTPKFAGQMIQLREVDFKRLSLEQPTALKNSLQFASLASGAAPEIRSNNLSLDATLTNTRGNFTQTGSESTGGGDFNLNALKLALQRPVDNENKLQSGFRAHIPTDTSVSTSYQPTTQPALGSGAVLEVPQPKITNPLQTEPLLPALPAKSSPDALLLSLALFAISSRFFAFITKKPFAVKAFGSVSLNQDLVTAASLSAGPVLPVPAKAGRSGSAHPTSHSLCV